MPRSYRHLRISASFTETWDRFAKRSEKSRKWPRSYGVVHSQLFEMSTASSLQLDFTILDIYGALLLFFVCLMFLSNLLKGHPDRSVVQH